METYHIPGIQKTQKQFFREFFQKNGTSEVAELVKIVRQYTATVRDRIERDGLNLSQLTLNSRTALFNIEGLINLHFHQVHPYVSIYQRVKNQQPHFAPLKNKTLVLRFTATHRLHHRIQLLGHQVHFLPSIGSVDMPNEYFDYLAQILYHKITGKSVPPRIRQEIVQLEMKESENLFAAEKPSPRPVHPNPVGKRYHLEEVFRKLNERYFNNQVPLPILRWSYRYSRKRLGYHDANRNLLVISRVLDDPRVPVFVMEGIMFHEMLHIVHPIRYLNGRRVLHSAQFKADEKKFEHYLSLKKWLKDQYPKYLKKVRLE